MDIPQLIHDHPEITIFFSMFIGHLIGKIKIGHFSLGSVVGTLLTGLVVGVAYVPDIPEVVRWAFFDLFLFAIGYSVGPQFFSSLKKSALPQIIISVTVNIGGLLAVIGCAWAMRFDTGTSAGLLSGSLTQSAALGTGISAIHELNIGPAEKDRLSSNVPVADAMTYVFGDIGLILLLVVILPAIFKIDLKKESADLEEAMRTGSSDDSESFFKIANKETLRAYVVTSTDFIGKSVKDIETQFVANRVYIEKVQRGGNLQTVAPELILNLGDIITIAGWRPGFIQGVEKIGPEIDSNEMLSVDHSERQIFVANKEIVGKTLSEVAKQGRGLFLKKILRGPTEMPLLPKLELHHGDILYLMGSTENLDRATKIIGFAESDPHKSDLAFLAFCVCLGTVLGLLSFHVGDIPLGLGSSGSILVVGLIAGWAQRRFPKVGRIPEPAQKLLIDIGLIVFIAVVGLKAGPNAVDAIKAGGVMMVAKILFAGAISTLVGPILGFLMGHYILKQNPALTLASLGGAQTAMPSLNALQDASESKILALSFTLPYAIGNILLTLWGPVIVAVSRLWQ
ncbi:aspartate-alanine antiporter [Bdellovibrio sp. ZAP7]|uniref:aspartate-alanine antiporter n=1 Tax=Bdellovibrio sp. ZAP7 TaxID=2231053 RepID=UPI00115775DA|nr:aspartate-alanine antiporter [Bdellovibrio sp. ZAP7]QDK46289.1 aspartate-alanine antiporter [Bdellovibrio sp. ZAP7]